MRRFYLVSLAILMFIVFFIQPDEAQAYTDKGKLSPGIVQGLKLNVGKLGVNDGTALYITDDNTSTYDYTGVFGSRYSVVWYTYSTDQIAQKYYMLSSGGSKTYLLRLYDENKVVVHEELLKEGIVESLSKIVKFRSFELIQTRTSPNPSYYVYEFDLYGPVLPPIPANLKAVPDVSAMSLTWEYPPLGSLEGFNVYQDGTKLNATPIPDKKFVVKNLSPKSYEFSVSAVDKTGLESPQSKITATPLPPDTTPPDVPKGLYSAIGDEQITLYWNPNKEPDLYQYHIYVDGVYKQSVPATNPNRATITGLNNFQTYQFSISAADTSGNESKRSPEVAAAPYRDIFPPDVPKGLRAAHGVNEVSLVWDANTEPDLALYHIYMDGVYLQSVKAPFTSVVIGNLTNGKAYSFSVSAEDTNKNESKRSAEVKATPSPDVTPPDIPKGLTATAGDRIINLSWSANKEPDLKQYHIYVNGTYLQSVPAPATSAIIRGLQNGTLYEITVTAADFTGNESAKSLKASATPYNKPAPGTGITVQGLPFTPGQIISNALVIIASLAAFILFGIGIMYVPHLIQLIREATKN